MLSLFFNPDRRSVATDVAEQIKAHLLSFREPEKTPSVQAAGAESSFWRASPSQAEVDAALASDAGADDQQASSL